MWIFSTFAQPWTWSSRQLDSFHVLSLILKDSEASDGLSASGWQLGEERAWKLLGGFLMDQTWKWCTSTLRIILCSQIGHTFLTILYIPKYFKYLNVKNAEKWSLVSPAETYFMNTECLLHSPIVSVISTMHYKEYCNNGNKDHCVISLPMTNFLST